MSEKDSHKGMGLGGAILWIILSFMLTPFVGIALAYFIFKDKEPKKWKTAKKIFWWTLLVPLALSLLLIFTSFLPYLYLSK